MQNIGQPWGFNVGIVGWGEDVENKGGERGEDGPLTLIESHQDVISN